MFSFDFLFLEDIRRKGEKKIIFQFLFFSYFSRDKYFRDKLFRSQVYIFFMFLKLYFFRWFIGKLSQETFCVSTFHQSWDILIISIKILIAHHSPMIDSSTNIE